MMEFGFTSVAADESAETVYPGKRALYNPAMPTQSPTGLDAAACDAENNSATAAALSAGFCQNSRQWERSGRKKADHTKSISWIADWMGGIDCVCCGSAAVTERPEIMAPGYRRFRCRDCGRQFNERSGGVLNRTSLPSDVIAVVVFCRLRYRLTLRDLSEILLLPRIVVSHEAVRD